MSEEEKNEVSAVSYPFKLAAWKTANFLAPNSYEATWRNFLACAGLLSVGVASGVIGLTNTSPDGTHIDGQEERISSYEGQILSIRTEEKDNLNKLRAEWRAANMEDKTAAKAELDTARVNFESKMLELISGLYTEDKVSETELENLLQKVNRNIYPIDTVIFNGENIPDIGDTAYLHECQVDNSYSTESVIDRAVNIAQCSADKNENESDNTMIYAPLAGVGAVGMNFLLAFFAVDLTNIHNNVERYARRERPQIKSKKNVSTF